MAGEVARARAKVLRDFEQNELSKHGATLRKALLAAAAEATGGDRAYSGLGGRPTLGVTLKKTSGSRSTTIRLTPSPKRAAGPWSWAQYGTNAGIRGVRPSRRRGRFSYFHPGTDGADAWFGTVTPELPRIRAQIRRNFSSASR